jgi:hypothetical protein
MKYRLKSNAPEFTAVDGELAGHTFRHGVDYENIPAGDESRFKAIEENAAVTRRGRKKDHPDGRSGPVAGKNNEEMSDEIEQSQS